ncbi:MAG: D-glucuronyl C5-epimerase family protein [Thaumarchaeota archaeon]|nr:D-glucuronyl C5-epimerase family protein [Nitrososphaerota archaeon]
MTTLFPAPIMVEDETILGRQPAVFDPNGVVTVPLMSPEGLKQRYVPTTICQFAMANYNMYVKTRDSKYREAMTRHTDWLLENFVDLGEFGAWQYKHDYSGPGYDCRSPWVSCMAQGQGISAMIRAYDLSPDDRKASVARKAARSFSVSVENGGVSEKDPHGCIIYKEYACRRSPTVLNGLVFGLFGLKEASDYFGDEDAGRSFSAGVDALKRHLGEFEVGVYPLFKWSRYDDRFIPLAALRYHKIHVRQLAQLYRMTGDEFFLRYAVKWKRYEDVYPNTPVYPLIYGLARRVGRRSQTKSLAKRRSE